MGHSSRKRLSPPPSVDFGVVSPTQHLWHFPPSELAWARVLGLFKQTVRTETLRHRRSGISHDTWQQPRHRFDDKTCGYLSSG